MKKMKKIFLVLERNMIKLISILNGSYYMKLYLKYLKKIGVNIEGTPNFISSSVYFDGTDYSKISIGDNSTISTEVMLLTHDGSIYTVSKGLKLSNIKILREKLLDNNSMVVKEIVIGKNTFIGARSFILPGTQIGNNVIVGAGSVVRGKIEDNSIVIGNPAKIVAKTDKWIDKKISLIK